MELIRGIHNIRARHHGCVLTIGNFDGVHRGHQALLEQLKQQGKRLGLPVMVMIFEPQPLEMFAADKAPARLTRLRDKANYRAGGRRLPAVRQVRSAFCRQHRAGVRRRAAGGKTGRQIPDGGDDFRFGAGRQGDFSLLQQAGKEYGFEVVSTPTFREGERRISSTAIRTALSEDDLPLAETLLGHPYSISGRVVHGDELGRTIGFPTANLPLKRLVAPVKGVYAVEVYGTGPQPLPGVANIGTRPTVAGVRQQLEVHLLDVTMDLYGRHIEVVLRAKLRNEQRFASLDSLKQQIANDVVTARKFFGLQTPV